jgi:homoserine O-acetyltransferase
MRLLFALTLLILTVRPLWALAPLIPPPQFAEFGECPLDSGAIIKDCRIGYRTTGTLNAARDNVIVFPTWFGGKSEHITLYLGPDQLIDTQKFFVIVVDSVGNGVSSSPSFSAAQSGSAFPAVSIRDMVRMQRRLLNEHFKVEKLHAVVGVSMGAMQALEWAVWQPDAANKFVAIAGTPRLAPYDVVFWQTQTRLIQMMIGCQCQTPMQALAGMRFLMLGAEAINRPYSDKEKILGDIAANNMDIGIAHDRLLQMQAMIGHDVSRHTGNDLAAAAKRVGTKLLVAVGHKDQVVTPAPVLEFAKHAGAKALEFPNCGHDVGRCGADLLFPAVRDFLAR